MRAPTSASSAIIVVLRCVTYVAALAAPGQTTVTTPYAMDYYGVTVPVFQCGLYCTFTQLAYAGVHYDPDLVRDHLDCSGEGISLSSIERVLHAHGLEATGVKSMSTDDLVKHLRSGGTAIVLVKRKDRIPHFTSVMAYRHSDFVCIEYPSTRCLGASKAAMDEVLSGSGGVALLVRRKTTEAGATNPSVEIVPREIDIGDLDGKDGDVKAEVQVKNRSGAALVISSFRASCGCMSITPSTKWLDPGQAATVTCLVHPKKWGATDRKSVYVDFADSSLAVFTLKAKPPRVLEAQSVVPIPAGICVTDDMFDAQGRFSRKVALHHLSNGNVNARRVESDSVWVAATVESGTAGQTCSDGSISLVIARLNSYGSTEASVYVTCGDHPEPVKIVVRQERAYPFEIHPSVLHFKASGSTLQSVQLRPRRTSAEFSIAAVDTGGPSIVTDYPSGQLNGPASVGFRVLSFGKPRWSTQKALMTVTCDGLTVSVPVTILLENDNTSASSHEGTTR